MRFLFAIFIGLSLLTTANATDYFRVRQKIVDRHGRYYYIYEVPVSKSPYYEVNTRPGLTKEDRELLADDIANLVVEKLAKAIAVEPEPEPVEPPSNSELDLKVQAILLTNCAKCHGNGEKSGKLSFIEDDKLTIIESDKTPDEIIAIKLLKYQIADAVETGRMPKGGEPLSDDDLSVLKNWVRKR